MGDRAIKDFERGPGQPAYQRVSLLIPDHSQSKLDLLARCLKYNNRSSFQFLLL